MGMYGKEFYYRNALEIDLIEECFGKDFNI